MSLIRLSGVAVGIAICFALLKPLCFASRKAPSVSARTSVLYQPDLGIFLYEKNADEVRPIASTTKIMTAYTVIRSGHTDKTVTVPKEAVGVEGSSLYLKAGERYTVRDLLYGLLLASANDVASTLAVSLYGSQAAFADAMNGVADELGLTNSHFMNPHGLDHPDHHSSARDLAILTAKAMEDPTFREIVGTKKKVIADLDGNKKYLVNHNKLLGTCEGVIGVKTGFTKKSGRCLVSCCERNGIRLIAVTLNAPDDWRDHAALYDYGYSRIRNAEILTAGSFTCTIPYIAGKDKSGTVTVTNAEGLTLPLPEEIPGLVPSVSLPHFAVGELKVGSIVGTLVYSWNNRTVAEIPLSVSAIDIP